MSQPDTLLIFDYSGTLSLEAPRFGRPENLLRALAESGLAALGVSTPEIFWGQIVNPTWVEGSTTQAGYKRVMAERIAALGLAPGASAEEIAAAASRFVDRYLDHSRIDPDWRPLLTRLSENPNVSYDRRHGPLRRGNGKDHRRARGMGHPGSESRGDARLASLREAKLGALPCRRPFFVANSADIGFWKVDAGFWEIPEGKAPPG